MWDDGTTTAVTQPSVHVATHTYAVPGVYSPSLLLVFSDGRPKSVPFNDFIEVTA